MKVIEAMKRVKANKEKIADLQQKIANNCALLSFETPPYGNEQAATVRGWVQACTDLTRDNVALLTAISRTNLLTQVTITLGGKAVTKPVAEWVWRRREYAAIDLATYTRLGDRGLKEGNLPTSSASAEGTRVTIVRFFDPAQRDAALDMFRSEPQEIDAALEVANAITDLVEA